MSEAYDARRDPYLIAHCEESIALHQKHENTVLRTPLQVIGDQRLRAHMFELMEPQGRVILKSLNGHFDAMETSQRQAWVRGLAATIRAAVPFLWIGPARRLAVSISGRSSLPSMSLAPEFFSCPFMWWTYDTAHSLTINDFVMLLEATLVIVVDSILLVSLIGVEGDDLDLGKNGRVVAYHFEYNLNDVSNPDLLLSEIIAQQSFISSAFIPKSVMNVPRPFRRRALEVGDRSNPKPVTFIDLRALESSERESSPGPGESRNWSHRWIVRGHLRAQWYPSTKTHRVIYVPPYIKGPEEMPLGERVYRVMR